MHPLSPNYFAGGTTSLPDAIARSSVRAGAYYAMLSEAVGQMFNAPHYDARPMIVGENLPWNCFAPMQSIVRDTNVNAEDTTRYDPGTSIWGRRSVLMAGSQIRMTTTGDPPVLIPIDLTRSQIEMVVDESKQISVTNLRLYQQSGTPVSIKGHAFADARLFMETMWTGSYSGPAPHVVSIDPASMYVQGDVAIDGVALPLRTRPTSASGTYNGVDQFSLLGTYSVDPTTTLQLELVVSVAPAPTAAITSIPSTVECRVLPNGAAGEVITVSGAVSPATAVPHWSLSSSRARYLHDAHTMTVDFTVPLETPTSPAAQVRLLSVADGRMRADTRQVRVVDSVAPVVLSSQIKPACGWGRTDLVWPYGEENAQLPSLCTNIVGQWTDLCSAVATTTFTVNYYAWPSGVLLESRQGQHCIQALAGHLNADMINVDVEVIWRARDSWGNESTQRRWRGYFYPGPAQDSCPGTTVAVTLVDEDIP